MGYIKTTPINTILAESCQMPFYLQDEVATSRFLVKQLYYNNLLAKKINLSAVIPKFQYLLEEHNITNNITEGKTNTNFTNKNLYINYTNVKSMTN